MKKNQLAKKILHKNAANPYAEMIPMIEEWFESAAGKELLEQQQEMVDELIGQMFGYHLMQVGGCRELDLHRNSKIQHCFTIGPVQGGNVVGLTQEHELPVESETIDVSLLHHAIEYSQHPHQLLKEVSRVTVASGHVVIIGFNPYSFMGLWSFMGRMRKLGVWQNRPVGIQRLVDWLSFTDLTVESIQYGYYKPPINNAFMQKLAGIEHFLNNLQLPFGGFYIMVAKKEVSRLTPIKSRWQKPRASMIPIMEPSVYTQHKDKKKTIH